MEHVASGLLVIVGTIVFIMIVVVCLDRYTVAPVPALIATAIFLWVLSMWLFGHIPDWGPFCHYPFWMVGLSAIVLLVAFFIQLIWVVWAFVILVVLGFAAYGLANADIDIHDNAEAKECKTTVLVPKGPTGPGQKAPSTTTTTTVQVPCPQGTTPTTTTTQPKNTTKVPTIKGYELHYYSVDPGVPGGYFGPACVPHGNANKCKRDILERVKHDPMLCSVMLRNFNVLKGVPDKPVRKPGESAADYAGRLNDWNTQVENARKATANSLAKSAARRKQCAAKVAFGFDTMQGFHIEALHGRFYTEFTDDNHNVTQTSKEMDPSKNFAIVATTPDGVVHYIKVDCGHQTVSKVPIPGVPPSKPPPPPPPPPPKPPKTPPTTPPTTVPPKNCRKVDPNPNTDADGTCDTRNVNKRPSTHYFQSLPPNNNHPVDVVNSQVTPTTVSPSGARHSPYGTETSNGHQGDSGSSDNPSDPPPKQPAQGTNDPDPYPGPKNPPSHESPCLADPSADGCGTGG